MTPDQFIAKWKAVELKERSAAQSHFIDLCHMLDEPAPTDADPTGDWYAFERGATKTTGGEGWADVWKRGHFGWEYKGKRKDLNAALTQLQQYVLALENPPYLGAKLMKRRLGVAETEAKVANRLRPHLARWRRIDNELSARLGAPVHFVVHRGDGGQYAEKIKTGWDAIVKDAGLGPDVVRHVLRHTAATWLMQLGTDPWQAAGWLGMTLEQLQENYGHHHPDFQEEAAEAFGGRRN